MSFTEASLPSFRVYGVNRSGANDRITIRGECNGVIVYPVLTYVSGASRSTYEITGNVARGYKAGSYASVNSQVQVVFDKPVTEVYIDQTGSRDFGISSVDFRCPPPPPVINEEGLGFTKEAPEELWVCEEIPYTFLVVNTNCAEKPFVFSDTLPAGLKWVPESLVLDSLNTENIGITVDTVYGRSNIMTITGMVVPGSSTIKFRAKAILDLTAPGDRYYENSAVMHYTRQNGADTIFYSSDAYHDGLPTKTWMKETLRLIPLSVTGPDPDKTCYSPCDTITLSFSVSNPNNPGDIDAIALDIAYSEEFKYVPNSFSAPTLPGIGSPQFDIDEDTSLPISGVLHLLGTTGDGFIIPGNGVYTLTFKVTAPCTVIPSLDENDQIIYTSDGAIVPMPLYAGFDFSSLSDDVCRGALFTYANGDTEVKSLAPVSISGANPICKGKTTTLSRSAGGTWTSSDDNIATVTNAGLVTATGAGRVAFTFHSEGCTAVTDTLTVTVPSISAPNSTICIGSTVQLSPNTGGSWASSISAVATVTTAGLVTGIATGTATMTYTASDGCINDLSITVAQARTVTAITYSDNPFCQSQSSATSAAPTVSGTNSGGGTFSSTTAGLIKDPDTGEIYLNITPGTYTVTYTLAAASGCAEVTKDTTVTILPLPTISTAATQSLCSGDNVNLFTLGGTSGSWDIIYFDGVSNQTITTSTSPYVWTAPSVTSSTAYTFNIISVKDNITNCVNTVTGISVTITVNISPSISTISAPSAVCANNNLSLTTPTVTGNGATVSSSGWEIETGIGTGIYTTFSSPYTVALADNGKKIRYTATNICGTEVSNAVAIVVNECTDLNLSKKANVAAVCNGSDVTFTIIVTNNATIPATNVIIIDTLPSGFTFKSTTASNGSYNSSTYKWTLATNIAVGGKDSVKIIATANTVGTITNKSYISKAGVIIDNDSYNDAQTIHRDACTVTVVRIFVYPDIRINICPSPVRSINLTKFLDSMNYQGVQWQKITASAPNIVGEQGTINSGDFNNSPSTYTYRYSLNTSSSGIECGTKSAITYVQSLKSKLSRKIDTIMVCRTKELSSYINLNQLLGLDLGGVTGESWKYDNTVNPTNEVLSKVKVLTTPSKYSGALIFDAIAAWNDIATAGYTITYKGDVNAKKFVFEYTPAPTSCIGETKRLVIVVSDN
jgi:uncharacterized repeat protein (TIGR01451 family)